MRAIDISHHTGPVTVEQAEALRDDHRVTRAIVGLQRPAIFRQQLQVLGDAGMELDVYIYLYFRTNVLKRVQTVLEQVAGFSIRRVWLDAEDTTAAMPAFRIAAQLQLAMEAVLDARRSPGIYTARWWWPQYMDGSTEFSGLPLWAAQWDKQETLAGFRPFGGWTMPEMKQFVGDSSEWAGVHADLNVYRAASDAPLEPRDSDEAALRGELRAALAHLDSAEDRQERLAEGITNGRKRIEAAMALLRSDHE